MLATVGITLYKRVMPVTKTLIKYLCKNLFMKELVLEAWSNRDLLKNDIHSDAVKNVIEELDKGKIRVAEPIGNVWQINEWVKQAILMYFGIQQMETFSLPPFEFYDKMKLKKRLCIVGRKSCSPCSSKIWCVSGKKRCTYAELCKYWCLC